MARTLAVWSAAALLVVAVAAAAVYALDMRRAYARIRGESLVVDSAYGAIEYKSAGAGPVVLVVHGSGGGFDQGELLAEAVLGEAFRWIAPSRFGYLRSTLPEGATFEDQAHAFAALLDALGVERVAVVALSHGGPAALLFAAAYPERVSSLTLISCGVAASGDAAQAEADARGNLLTTIFRYDALYWAASTLAQRRLMELMGAPGDVIAGLSAEQRGLIERVIDYMNPVAPRAAGVGFDNRAALPNERIAAIRAPTLVVHAVDDSLQLYRNAEFALTHIPDARLLRFERGGHLVVAVEQAAIGAEVQRFVRAHAQR